MTVAELRFYESIPGAMRELTAEVKELRRNLIQTGGNARLVHVRAYVSRRIDALRDLIENTEVSGDNVARLKFEGELRGYSDILQLLNETLNEK